MRHEVSDLANGTHIALVQQQKEKRNEHAHLRTRDSTSLHVARYSRSPSGVALISLLLTAAVSGCTGKVSGANVPPPAPQVSVVITSAQDTPIFNEYVGQTFARDMVEVRGRVDGYIEKRLFETGADVVAGQPLYVLDLRPYEAEVRKRKVIWRKALPTRSSRPAR